MLTRAALLFFLVALVSCDGSTTVQPSQTDVKCIAAGISLLRIAADRLEKEWEAELNGLVLNFNDTTTSFTENLGKLAVIHAIMIDPMLIKSDKLSVTAEDKEYMKFSQYMSGRKTYRLVDSPPSQ